MPKKKHLWRQTYKNEAKESNAFVEKELELLKEAEKMAERRLGKKQAQAPEVQSIIQTLEEFLRRKKLICYGGTAINNILPTYDQFYEKDVEIPDYDFYTADALNDAKELADIYAAAGYVDVQAKAGVHHGTYKVFVNFIPVADLTLLDKRIMNKMLPEVIERDGILYAPPNFLRMNVYLELSRPAGDVARWEKIYKRLQLINKHFPMLDQMKKQTCKQIDFLREMSNDKLNVESIYVTVRNTLIDAGTVFIGGYATSLYGRYMPADKQRQLKNVPDFDVLSTDYEKCAEQVKAALMAKGHKGVKIKKIGAVGEIMPAHYQVFVGTTDCVCMIYQTNGCQSYNIITMEKQKVKVASIETLLYFLLAFTYVDLEYYNKDTIMCMAAYIFDVQYHNRLEQKGLLKRFSLTCYGTQESKESIFAEKGRMAKELTRGTQEWDDWFLNYNPLKNKNKTKKTKKNLTKEKTPLLKSVSLLSSNSTEESNHISTPRHAQTVFPRKYIQSPYNRFEPPPQPIYHVRATTRKKRKNKKKTSYFNKMAKLIF
jgi:hypothetical protein